MGGVVLALFRPGAVNLGVEHSHLWEALQQCATVCARSRHPVGVTNARNINSRSFQARTVHLVEIDRQLLCVACIPVYENIIDAAAIHQNGNVLRMVP